MKGHIGNCDICQICHAIVESASVKCYHCAYYYWVISGIIWFELDACYG